MLICDKKTSNPDTDGSRQNCGVFTAPYRRQTPDHGFLAVYVVKEKLVKKSLYVNDLRMANDENIPQILIHARSRVGFLIFPVSNKT